MSARFVTLVAGIFFFFAALVTQGFLPFFEPSARTNRVTAVVRTDFGQLKWMMTEATDYTPLQQLGRDVYLREGCWYCHSQYVRPVTGETRRWGPVTESGEFAYDVPHLFGTRRIGPDLMRVGLKFSDEWHLAHFWNPRMLSPDSIMAPYRGLFDEPAEPVKIVDDGAGNRTLERTPVSEGLFDFASKEQIRLTPNADGLLFVPMQARGKVPVIVIPNEEYKGDAIKIAAETKDLEALIAYVQKLGMNRGKWRDLFEPQQLEVTEVTFPRSSEWIAHGREVYERRCLGCHGVNGDGNGPAATFLHIQRPRSFAAAVFKFRLTKEPLPTDGDLLRTITRGVRGTAMPAWYELPLTDRLAVIQYIKYELAVDRSDPAEPYAFFIEEPPGPPLYIAKPPTASQQILDRGKEVWQIAKCWECHGMIGKGDGQKAAGLKDDLGFGIVPADLTSGQFKSGTAVEDIFRTMTTGLSGTPMPSYRDALPEEDRWALSYYVLALSAYKDPLTLQPLTISDTDRAALNDLTLEAVSPDNAYVPGASPAQKASELGEGNGGSLTGKQDTAQGG
ncbi:Cb-type cytochrome c oxidase subunit II [Mesorhizobium prunaredense]|uniref:Cb-type cytochrome c oxidase subunit II n=1 Tax=Mesorhizobium prunaredense TaxID=1631249 RepID=A0A1R3V509_9HYPH|nr:cbb3-type cytochrome c oxidase subunit II [Mesorhizobium prunaredense]SIT54910.1 Cb-type cytochrome c oxidase subunit II [Mesorhizobium prunaredense]